MFQSGHAGCSASTQWKDLLALLSLNLYPFSFMSKGVTYPYGRG